MKKAVDEMHEQSLEQGLEAQVSLLCSINLILSTHLQSHIHCVFQVVIQLVLKTRAASLVSLGAPHCRNPHSFIVRMLWRRSAGQPENNLAPATKLL